MEKALKKFEESFTTLGLMGFIERAQRLIVAFSGGADSCLLLYLTCKYFILRGKIVECAHLNHMIRGDEADRDENFCIETARKLGVKLHLRRVNIPELGEKGGSIEEIARKERYKFFGELTEGKNDTLVFTAHNADDNLETVLFNLVRGTSLSGLCGIPPEREGIYLRPLLKFSSAEIRETCERLGIGYVTDSTNFESDYTRNHIRNLVVPLLKKINPAPEVTVGRMSSSLRLDREYLELEAQKFAEEKCLSGISSVDAVLLHDSILSRVIIREYSAVADKFAIDSHLEKIHVDDIMKHLRKNGNIPFSISLPGEIVFRSENGVGAFLHNSECVYNIDSDETVLELNKPVMKNGYTVVLTKDFSSFFKKNENIYNLSIHKSLKFDKIKGKLKIRIRRSGDIFRYGGMTHKVKKIFSEKKLSTAERQTLPIVCDDVGILWIPGFPLRDGVSEGEGDRVYLICLKISEQDKNCLEF